MASCLLVVAAEFYRSGWNGFGGQGHQNLLFLPDDLTKNDTAYVVPMSSRRRVVLEMRRTDPKGEVFPADACVFGDETGQ